MVFSLKSDVSASSVARQKYLTARSRSAWSQLCLWLPVMLLCKLDCMLLNGLLVRVLVWLLPRGPHPWLLSVGLSAEVLLGHAALVLSLLLVVLVLWPRLTGLLWEIEVTTKQAKLYGVTDQDAGFKVTDTPSPTASKSPQTSSPAATGSRLLTTPSQLSWLFNVQKRSHHDQDFDRSSSAYSPSQSFLSSSSYSPVYGNDSYHRLSSGSFGYSSPGSSPRTLHNHSSPYSPGDSYNPSSPSVDSQHGSVFADSPTFENTSFNSSFSSFNQSGYGMGSPGHSLTRLPPAEHLLRLRRARSVSPFCRDTTEGINTEEQLVRFLDDYDRTHSHTSASLGHGSALFDAGLSMNRSFDISRLENQRYRLSTQALKAPQLPKTDAATGTVLSYKELSLAALYKRLEVEEKLMEVYTRNIRFWLSKKVLKPLVADIERVNSELTHLGRSDLLIGVVDPLTLTQMFGSKSHHLASHSINVDAIAPYLTICSDQKFLLQKLKDWARDTYLGGFHWYNSVKTGDASTTGGGLSDASLLMRIFCTHMDSVLPAHPLYTYCKVFTSEYFTTQKSLVPSASATGGHPVGGLGGTSRTGKNVGPPIKIWQSVQNPPHFELILEKFGELADPGKGRNNVFSTIALFFRFFNVYCANHIEALSLSDAGLGVDWVFSNTGPISGSTALF